MPKRVVDLSLEELAAMGANAALKAAKTAQEPAWPRRARLISSTTAALSRRWPSDVRQVLSCCSVQSMQNRQSTPMLRHPASRRQGSRLIESVKTLSAGLRRSEWLRQKHAH